LLNRVLISEIDSECKYWIFGVGGKIVVNFKVFRLVCRIVFGVIVRIFGLGLKDVDGLGAVRLGIWVLGGVGAGI
jgi:hypothetical protein